jgi:Tfp pilus assembly protein PilO
MDTTYSAGKTNKFSIMAIFLFILALAALVFYIKPSWDEVTNLSLARDEKVQQKQTLQQNLTDLQKIQEQLNATSEVNRETSLAAIPEKLEEDNLILDFANITRKNDIVLNSISFGIPVGAAEGEIQRATVNATLVGTEGDLIKFLRAVEANGRKILVKSITVQLASTETGVKLANFNISMETYFQGKI